MNDYRESATGAFGAFGHTCSESDLGFDLIAIIEPLRLGFDEQIIVLDSDLDRIADDHFPWDVATSHSDVGDVINLDGEAEVYGSSRQFGQFGGLVDFLSGMSDDAQA